MMVRTMVIVVTDEDNGGGGRWQKRLRERKERERGCWFEKETVKKEEGRMSFYKIASALMLKCQNYL